MSDDKGAPEGVAQVLVDRGREALRAGDRRLARRYFTTAVARDPACASAWRGLADVAAEPETALKYLQQAQTLTPADASLRWAIQRVQAQLQQVKQSAPAASVQLASKALPDFSRPRPPDFAPVQLKPYPSRWRWIIFGLVVIVLLALVAVACWVLAPGSSAQGISPRGVERPAAVLAPSAPAAHEPVVAQPAASGMETTQVMGMVEDWSRQAITRLVDQVTKHQEQTPTAQAGPTPSPQAGEPPVPDPAVSDTTDPAKAGKWIDISISRQTLTAYQGNTPVLQAVVSTGISRYPTPTGRYTIQRKYRAVHMSGPGYSLPNVPYAMFFYRGYAIHGTYWHDNFGTPMSHGCINIRTDQAGWLYNWAPVGTPVVIHY
jgi:lipoprotein-anchoring transpeptidase ErfK/SrfK